MIWILACFLLESRASCLHRGVFKCPELFLRFRATTSMCSNPHLEIALISKFSKLILSLFIPKRLLLWSFLITQATPEKRFWCSILVKTRLFSVIKNLLLNVWLNVSQLENVEIADCCHFTCCFTSRPVSSIVNEQFAMLVFMTSLQHRKISWKNQQNCSKTNAIWCSGIAVRVADTSFALHVCALEVSHSKTLSLACLLQSKML